MWKSKVKAFLIHLSISAAIVGSFFAIIFFVWYPEPYFHANGAWSVIRVLVLVDLILGPVLTLVLFKPKKRGLIFDMCVIAAVQLAALVYGVSVIYKERPLYVVFNVDRFSVVAASEVDQNKLKYDELKSVDHKGPVLVAAIFPEDKKEREKLLFEVVFEKKPDIERRPEYYERYVKHKEEIISNGKNIDVLIERNKAQEQKIKAFLSKQNGKIEDFVYLPLVGKNKDMAMILNRNNGLPAGGINVDPWLD